MGRGWEDGSKGGGREDIYNSINNKKFIFLKRKLNLRLLNRKKKANTNQLEVECDKASPGTRRYGDSTQRPVSPVENAARIADTSQGGTFMARKMECTCLFFPSFSLNLR